MILIVCPSDVGSHHHQPGFTLGRDVQSETSSAQSIPHRIDVFTGAVPWAQLGKTPTDPLMFFAVHWQKDAVHRWSIDCKLESEIGLTPHKPAKPASSLTIKNSANPPFWNLHALCKMVLVTSSYHVFALLLGH